ncbi:hypothetical protein [uncultured Dialister sp.]|jgi:hypothetical protein|uniref:hypothetical protein n=1 Tax=uncultured Dialister sp. TaxID=278064 RepID=UPI002636866E|nr:hypothetical protein [uncultured Dialister sp.]
MSHSACFSREALIKSVFAFILEILCNARNGMTQIASYLRNPMTQQCIKFLMKVNSMNESVLPWLPVFTGVPVTCDAYPDSSLALRMTAAEGGERIIRHAFLAAGIYWRSSHL